MNIYNNLSEIQKIQNTLQGLKALYNEALTNNNKAMANVYENRINESKQEVFDSISKNIKTSVSPLHLDSCLTMIENALKFNTITEKQGSELINQITAKENKLETQLN